MKQDDLPRHTPFLKVELMSYNSEMRKITNFIEGTLEKEK